MNSTERKDDAAGPLDLLAVQLRKLGLTVTIVRDPRTPFPALLVSAGTQRAVVMAGRAHYWRKLPNGDMQGVAPLDKPERAARVVHEHLTEPRHARRSSHFRFWQDAGAPVGGIRGMAVTAGGPPPVGRVRPLRPVDACEVAR